MRGRKSVSRKVVVLLLAVVLLVGCAVGGTLAWLLDKTDPIVNTFSTANIDITLTETFNTDSDADTKNDIWKGKLVPGTSIAKDPMVTVEGGSEACWLFVKVDEAGGSGTYKNKTYSFDNYVTYEIITGTGGWTELETGVYYREVAAGDVDQEFYILTGNTVSISENVTKDMMDAIDNGNITAPSLTFTAYAVQREGFDTAPEAWTEAKKLG